VLASALHEAEIGWAWEPSVLLGLAVAALLYSTAAGPVMAAQRTGSRRARWQAASFFAGLVAIFIALVSPLDALADGFLFSAHMAQHLLLMMVAVPLMMIGLPSWMYARLFPRGWPRRALGWLTRPVPAFLLFNLTLGAWHLPRLYGLALEHEGVHILQHLMLLVAAGIGWWPVLGNMPAAAPRPSLGVQVVYLFLQGFPSTALAALITLAPNPLYAFYATAPRIWGISVQADQMWSGLLMWMPGAMVYLAAATVVFFRWFGADEAIQGEPIPAAVTATGEVMHG
jgi:cytochrome c oxidase assembly factor CtaG